MMLKVKTNPLWARTDFALLFAAMQNWAVYTDNTASQKISTMKKIAGSYVKFLDKHFYENELTLTFKQISADIEDLEKALSAGTLSPEAATDQLVTLTDRVDAAMETFKNA